MRRRNRGFSLVELIVVVTVLSILLAIAAFTFGANSSPYYQIRSTSRQVAGTMEQARISSAITGRLVRLEYDLDFQVVRTLVQRQLTPDEDATELELDDLLQPAGSVEFGNPDRGPDRSRIWLDSIQTFDGKSYDRGLVHIDIKPKGTPIGHIVNLSNSDGEQFSIELNPMTGNARVYDEYKKVERLARD